MSKVGVIATLKIQDGKNSEFEKAFLDLRKQVKANEEGCLLYDVFKSKSDPNTYIIQEQYASQEALEAHGKSEHFKAAQPALGGTIAAAPDIVYLDAVE